MSRSPRRPRSTGFVAAKIRQNTARRNGFTEKEIDRISMQGEHEGWLAADPYGFGYGGADRNDALRKELLDNDIVLGQTPDYGKAGVYTAYYFEMGIPGNPNTDQFWESNRTTGEPLWAHQAEVVRVRMPAKTSIKKIEEAIYRKLDWE